MLLLIFFNLVSRWHVELNIELMHKFGALAFLQLTDVIKRVESLSFNLNNDYQDMIDYFEETYIGQVFLLKLVHD